jgi:hypothetical protein
MVDVSCGSSQAHVAMSAPRLACRSYAPSGIGPVDPDDLGCCDAALEDERIVRDDVAQHAWHETCGAGIRNGTGHAGHDSPTRDSQAVTHD